MITTEDLLRNQFGISTLQPAQAAAARVIDGLPLGELATHPDVEALIGCKPEALPSEAPGEVVFLASVRSGKTMTAAAAAIRMSQSVDLTGLGPGEVARVSIVSLTVDLAAAGFGILRQTIQSDKSLRRLLVGEPTADAVHVRHPTGRIVEVKCVAAAKAGASLVARWSAGIIVDEAPRFVGREDGSVNLEDLRSAILGRLRPGAQALYIGSAWAPAGPVYDWTQERFGKPGTDLIILRGTGVMLNPAWWTPERCAALEAADPVAYRCDVLGDFSDPEQGLLSPIVVRQHTRLAPLDLPFDPTKRYACAVDPSEGSTKSNGFTLVLLEVDGHQDSAQFRVAVSREWRGVRPDDAWGQIAATLKPYGVSVVVSDQYSAAANADLARRHGLTLFKRSTTAASKIEDYSNLANILHQGRLELAPDKVLVGDLLALRKRFSQTGGFVVILPRTTDGRHCDFAPSLAAALRSTAYRGWAPKPGEPMVLFARRSERDDRPQPKSRSDQAFFDKAWEQLAADAAKRRAKATAEYEEINPTPTLITRDAWIAKRMRELEE